MISRFLGKKSQAQPKVLTGTLDNDISAVQAGDIHLRNQIISEYRPFVLKITSKVCKRYIDDQDDEFSIALVAFNEAIDAYDQTQKASFLSFSELVMKRRLIDHIRKQQKFQNQLPMTAFEIQDDEDHFLNPVEIKQAQMEYEEHQTQEKRKEDILAYVKELANYGISLNELVEISPKHKDARENLFSIADILVKDDNMLSYLKERKSIPIKDLLPKVEVSRKTIERNRKYIIALVLIQINDFYFLKDYLQI